MPSTTKYIAKVYSTLSVGILCTSFGTYFPGIHWGIPFVTAALLMINCSWNESQMQQATSFLLVSFCNGVIMADTLLCMDTEIIATAFSTTLIIFMTISLAAFLSKDTSTLMSYAILGGIINVMIGLTLVNIFVQNQSLFLVDIILGIFIFSCYIFLDTIKIIDSYEESGLERIGADALGLYLDLVNLFIRMLIALKQIRGDDEYKKKK